MKLLVKRISDSFDRLLTFTAIFTSALLIFIMLLIVYEIVMRVFIRQGQFWVLEVSEYSLLYITFLAAAWLLKREGHVKMDIFLNRLKPKAQTILNIVTSTLGAGAFLLVTFYGIQVTWEYFRIGAPLPTALEPPAFLISLAIPIGSFLFFVQLLKRIYGFTTNLKDIQESSRG